MGDRRIAEIVTSNGSLYVYTHNSGLGLPEDARSAVARARPRWGDESYATRIIVDELIREGRDSELGFGISLVADMEDEYNGDKPSVIIDLVGRQLTVIDGVLESQQGFEHV